MAASTSSIQFSVYRLHSLIITYTLFVRHQLLTQIQQNAIHPHLKNMSSMAKKIISTTDFSNMMKFGYQKLLKVINQVEAENALNFIV